MVELESENETTKLSSKINVLNQNVQTLCFLLMSWWKSLTIQNRPQGSWESKRQQYFKMFEREKNLLNPKGNNRIYYSCMWTFELNRKSGIIAKAVAVQCSAIPSELFSTRKFIYISAGQPYYTTVLKVFCSVFLFSFLLRYLLSL